MASSSSSSSKRGRRRSSEKLKQPQRGLGVAELEKIRLRDEMSCNGFNYPPLYPSTFTQDDVAMQKSGYSSVPSVSYSSLASYGHHPSMMIGSDEYGRGTKKHGDAQPTPTAGWSPVYGILESQHFAQSNMTQHFLNLPGEDSRRQRKPVGSGRKESESSDTEEPDLELRLSL